MCKPSAEPSLPELCRGEAINRTCEFQFIGHVFYKYQAVEQLFQNYKSLDEYQRLMNNMSPKKLSK